MITIHEAVTERQRAAVDRLRYEIYVEEMQRPQTWADHERRTIREPIDDYSRIFYALDNERLVGTIRTTFASDGPLECEALYGLDRLAVDRKQISMTTKLMVRAEYRQQSSLGARLAMHTFDHNVARGVLLDFIDTNSHLVPFYTKIGYRRYQSEIDHPDYGRVLPMVLVCDDVPYLEQIRSPFRRTARQQFGDGPYRGAAAFPLSHLGRAAMRRCATNVAVDRDQSDAGQGGLMPQLLARPILREDRPGCRVPLAEGPAAWLGRMGRRTGAITMIALNVLPQVPKVRRKCSGACAGCPARTAACARASEPGTMPLSVRVAEGAAVPQSVLRLRYQTYVVEQRKHYVQADHERGTLSDDWDTVSTHLYVSNPDGACVASVRLTPWVAIPHESRIEHGFRVPDDWGVPPERAAITSFLVTSRQRRGASRAMRDLVRAAFTLISHRGDLVNLIHTREDLVPLFEHMGFRRLGRSFVWPSARARHELMAVFVDDVHHLESVDSPLAPIARHFHGLASDSDGAALRHRMLAGPALLCTRPERKVA